jgi:predicted nucleic acid-binding protein
LTGLVIDASVTMAWCFEDETTDALDALLDRVATESATVPASWRLEVANVLLVAERRGRLTPAQTARFVALLTQLPIEVEAEGSADMSGLIGLGRAYGLSAYDAEYLALAAKRGLPLATLDADLRAACTTTGVQVA